MMGAMSWGHWAIVILVVILLFGRGVVSSLMADVGKAIREVRKIGADNG